MAESVFLPFVKFMVDYLLSSLNVSKTLYRVKVVDLDGITSEEQALTYTGYLVGAYFAGQFFSKYAFSVLCWCKWRRF